MASISVDPEKVLLMFSELDSKRQKKAHRNALRKGTNILVREARKSLKTAVKKTNSKNWWNGKTLSSGIKSSINKEVTEGKVHIMGDFRLKLFELGTKLRKTSGANRASVRGKMPRYRQHKPSNRGSIKASNFFLKARNRKEKEISDNMNTIIAESIRKVNEQFKGR